MLPIDQEVLIKILKEYIVDEDIISLFSEIIHSFYSTKAGIGLPFGNLTSQLLVNIYMNEFDQFVKHKLKAKYYIRYADDFIVLLEDKAWLEGIIPRISDFLWNGLKLTLHPEKLFLKTLSSGIDFLGCRYNGCYDDCKAYLGNKPKVQAPVLYYANSEF